MRPHVATLAMCVILPTAICSYSYSYSCVASHLPSAKCPRSSLQEVTSKKGDSRHRRYGNFQLQQTPAFPRRERSRVFLILRASTSSNEGESGSLEAARQRAETALRKLSPSELGTIIVRLNLREDGLQDTEDIIKRAVPILAGKILAKEAVRISLSSEALAGENRPDGTPAPKSTSQGALEIEEERWAGGVKDGVRTGKRGGGERGEWMGSPGEGAVEEWRVDRELEPPLGSDERVYFATCPRGLETVLRDELISPTVGAKMVKTSGRGCHFCGDQAVGYRAILWLRTAHRVLEMIAEGGTPSGHAIDSADSLYKTAAAVKWSRYMQHGQTLSVDAILGVVSDGLTHSHFTALTVKNAVVDQFRQYGERPSVDTDYPDLPLVVYLDRGRAVLYRSLTGTRSMHKRGYREAMHAASLKENVAAGLLLASGWDPDTQVLADPMCGSGTFLIEAALIAMRRAPGLVAMGAFREKGSRDAGWAEEGGWRPAIRSWPDFDARLWREVIGDALQAARPSPPMAIVGNDWHHDALSLAWRDAKAAGVEKCIALSDDDVSGWRPPTSVDLAVTNPPWDYRLDRDAEQSWIGLLDFLRREVAEKDAWVLSGNPSLSRLLRMKSEQNMYLAIGGVELRWLQYRLHAYRGDGTRRRGRGRVGVGSRPKKVSRLNDRPAVDRW